jgi:hypothetical protein
MSYSYPIEAEANKGVELIDLFRPDSFNVFYILCYCITTDTKYPFIQFLMDKIPACGEIIKEQLMLPYVLFNNSDDTISHLVVERVKLMLSNMNCDTGLIDEAMYKGILYDEHGNANALINLTGGVDISNLHLKRDDFSWFVLPSEIINNKHVLNIPIDGQLVDLFVRTPDLAVVKNVDTLKPYNIPDVVYSGGEFKRVEFSAIFGHTKSREYSQCGAYYYFYRQLEDAIKEAGWVKAGGDKKVSLEDPTITHNEAGRLIVDNEYGRYIQGGLNRYAVFMDGKNYIESNREFMLTDAIINYKYAEPCIIIGYTGDHEIKADLLVKEYESFWPLSYHSLNKEVLGEHYNPMPNLIWIK